MTLLKTVNKKINKKLAIRITRKEAEMSLSKSKVIINIVVVLIKLIRDIISCNNLRLCN